MAYNKVEAMWIPTLDPKIRTKYIALVEAISAAIRKGELRAGDRLPTHRDLAWELKLNVSTISQGYKEATKRHLIGGEVGRGTFVLANSREAELFALKDAETQNVIDLSTNIPAVHPDDYDTQALFLKAINDGAGLSGLSYHSPDLLIQAKAAASKWLSWRGMEVEPRSIVPCAGGQQGLLATLLVICEPGAVVLVERHTFPGMKAIARQLRLKLVGIDCDAEGIKPGSLTKAITTHGASVLVLNPNLHNPTGITMTHERGKQLSEVIQNHEIVVVEDDVYGPLSGNAPFAKNIPEYSILLSSLSKSVAPALRFGFISGSDKWIDPIKAEVHATNWAMSPFMIEVACLWINSGRAFARADWQRHEIESRWGLVKARLKNKGKVRWEDTPCPHLWLAVSKPIASVVVSLREKGLEVVSGELFGVGGKGSQHIRICLTAPETRAELSQALDKLIESNILSA